MGLEVSYGAGLTLGVVYGAGLTHRISYGAGGRLWGWVDPQNQLWG